MQPDSLRQLQNEIETLLGQLRHPVLVENQTKLMDLAAARWRLNVEFGKLVFTAWISGKSISRRVEEIAYRDRDRFGLFVRRPGGRETTTLEFRELAAPESTGRAAGRAGFRQQLLDMLQREYRGWKFERTSNRSDRERTFSAWYTRGLARQGRSGWAFLGLGEEEGSAAADDVLAFGLIWFDWLRSREQGITLSQLKLFLPPAVIPMIAPRAAILDPRVVRIEIYEWRPGMASPAQVDLRDCGNIETRLAPRRQAELLMESHASFIHDLLAGLDGKVELHPDPGGTSSSLRIAGLEVARIEGQLSPRVLYGLEGSFRRLDASCHDDFREFLREVQRIRRADGPAPQHDFYRLQSERWLESLLFRDITRIDPALLPEHVYSQVPAFSGQDRGVIDLLAMTRAGRLAVIELKVQEEINLPLQGLDYWLRVNWLQQRNQFKEFGYFGGRELSKIPPLLYLVSPAFRFHSTTKKLLAYLDTRVEVVLIGLNDSWRREIKVLFRQPRSRSTAF